MDTPDPISHAETTPDIAALQNEWNKIGKNRRNYPVVADDIRFCRWSGQNADGRKHDNGLTKAFPWEGASDTRPMVADRLIGETVATLKEAFWRATAKQKAADDEVGTYCTRLIEYFIFEKMTSQLQREVELSAQYMQTYGWFVLHPTWEQRLSLRRQTVTLQELVLLAAQLSQDMPVQPDLSTLAQTVLEPELEDVALQQLRFIYDAYARQNMEASFEVEIPAISDKTLRKALRELRSNQETSIAVPFVAKDGPSIMALKPWDEIFTPDDTTDVESSRVWFQREWVTETTLLERERTEGYDPRWVKEAVKHKGRISFDSMPEGQPGSALSNSGTQYTQSVEQGNRTDFIEIIHCVRKSIDDDGVPAVYKTTIHPSICQVEGRELYAKHELLDYPHGEYPYVGGAREYHCRRFTSSRGIPEIVTTRQNEKKALLDAMIDRTSITVLPPVNVYPTTVGSKFRFGPAVQNTVMQGKEPRFMEMPSGQGLNESIVAIDRIDYEIDNLFGMRSDKVPPERSQLIQSSMVAGFLVAWTQALGQLVSLAQRFMASKEFSKATGAPEGWLEGYRDKPGALRVQLEFDVRELDPELIGKQIEAVSKVVLPSDATGAIDRRKLVELQLRAINPRWAKELMLPGQAASQQLFETVRNDLAQMFLGNEAHYIENDPTAATKLQYAQQIVGSNPTYQEALKTQGRFSELLNKWVQSLQFNVQQEQNKTIGRIGVTPEGPQA